VRYTYDKDSISSTYGHSQLKLGIPSALPYISS
jgi:hypothetical protein